MPDGNLELLCSNLIPGRFVLPVSVIPPFLVVEDEDSPACLPSSSSRYFLLFTSSVNFYCLLSSVCFYCVYGDIVFPSARGR
jgi:hypothetical protein